MAPGKAEYIGSVGEADFVDPGFVGFTLEKGLTTRLYGVYSKQSTVAMALKTKAIAKIPVPETPRSLAGSLVDEEEEGESIQSSVDDEGHEQLFNDLSNALADGDGDDKDLAKR